MVEVILGFFAAGAVGFWMGLVAVVLTLFYTVEEEKYFWATFWIIAFTLFVQFIAKYNVFSYIFRVETIYWFISYLIAGTLWSFAKWYLFVRDAAKKFKIERTGWLKSKISHEVRSGTLKAKGYGITELEKINEETGVPDVLKTDWKEYIRHLKLKPQAADNKEKITGWIFYWPISMFWFFLRDFLKRIVDEIYNFFKRFYQKITDRAFKGLE